MPCRLAAILAGILLLAETSWAELPPAGQLQQRLLHAAQQLENIQWEATSHDADRGYRSNSRLVSWARRELSSKPSKLNCWEMVYLAAFEAGMVSKRQIAALDDKASKRATRKYQSMLKSSGSKYKVNAQLTGLFAHTEASLGPLGYFGAPKLNRPDQIGRGALKAGDVVFFGFDSPSHAALALGSRTASGEHEVLSLGRGPIKSIERTTIEALGRRMRSGKMPPIPIRIGRPNWAKLAARAKPRR